VYIAAVFESGGFGKFECDDSLENSGGNRFDDKLFVIKVFFVFSLGDIKDLSASVTFYRIIALTNLVIWLIIASDRINN
jgi:hypothetical protein